MEIKENENEELLHNSETENTDTQSAEEVVENVDGNTNSDNQQDVENNDNQDVPEKKSFRDLLRENPEYQERFNELVQRRVSAKERSVREEYDKKYSKIDNVLKYGLQANDIDDAADKLKQYYEDNGVTIPDVVEQRYSQDDLMKLARMDADEISDMGIDEVIEETERLSKKGADNMSAREKLTFKFLAEKRNEYETTSELLKNGAKKEVYESKEYREFAKKFEGSKFSAKEIYDFYKEKQPKDEVKQLGSMANNSNDKTQRLYTPEQAAQLSKEDMSNPEIFKAVQESMKHW